MIVLVELSFIELMDLSTLANSSQEAVTSIPSPA